VKVPAEKFVYNAFVGDGYGLQKILFSSSPMDPSKLLADVIVLELASAGFVLFHIPK
jgi:hypothetical protein